MEIEPIKSTKKRGHLFTVPKEFRCVISKHLMRDPFTVFPTRLNVEPACIKACKHLQFIPPILNNEKDFDDATDICFYPNEYLKDSIQDWCQDTDRGLLPQPLLSEDARLLVQQLRNSIPLAVSDNPPRNPLIPGRTRDQESQQVSQSRKFELIILKGLRSSDASLQKAARIKLIEHVEGNEEKSIQICTQRILSAILPLLNSHENHLQMFSIKAIMELSRPRENRTKIVNNGAVAHLIPHLSASWTQQALTVTRTVTAIYNLAKHEENRTVMGALGAIPPLLDLIFDLAVSYIVREEAAASLFHLSLCLNNLSILANTKAVPQLMVTVAAEDSNNQAVPLQKYAVGIICNMSRSVEGRIILIEEGCIQFIMKLLTEEPGMEKYYFGMLFDLYTYCLVDFKVQAVAANADVVLATPNAEWGKRHKEMARMMMDEVKREETEGSGGNPEYRVSDTKIDETGLYKDLTSSNALVNKVGLRILIQATEIDEEQASSLCTEKIFSVIFSQELFLYRSTWFIFAPLSYHALL